MMVVYGERFRRRVRSLLIKEVITAPRSPWQNPYVERIIGSIRRDCLDRIIVFNEGHLKRILTRYFEYYHRWRTHLGLEMDAPQGREAQVPDNGKVTESRPWRSTSSLNKTRSVRSARIQVFGMDRYHDVLPPDYRVVGGFCCPSFSVAHVSMRSSVGLKFRLCSDASKRLSLAISHSM